VWQQSVGYLYNIFQYTQVGRLIARAGRSSQLYVVVIIIVITIIVVVVVIDVNVVIDVDDVTNGNKHAII